MNIITINAFRRELRGRVPRSPQRVGTKKGSYVQETGCLLRETLKKQWNGLEGVLRSTTVKAGKMAAAFRRPYRFTLFVFEIV